MGSQTIDRSTKHLLIEQLAANARSTDREAKFPAENIKLLGEHNYLGLLVPTKLGGQAASALEFAETVQSIGCACASTGMIFVMHCCGIDMLSKHSTKSDKILREAAAGKHLSTIACSERGTGANFYASFSKSEEVSGQYELNGDKCFVTSGGIADSYVVPTQAVGSDDSVNTTMYVVPSETPGLSFYGSWEGLGLRGNNSVGMKLDHCKIPKDNLIGNQGQGLELELGSLLPRFLLGTAAVYNGIAEAALTATIEHCTKRVHSHTTEALIMLPVLRGKIAQMKVSVDSSVALMTSAAQAWDSGSATATVSLLEAKQLACRTAVGVTTMAMEVCGGIAYSGTLSVERHFRDAQAGVVMAPTNDVLLDLIGRAVVGLPLM